jgi:hypothetical protein
MLGLADALWISYPPDRPHQGIGNATIQYSELGTGEIECKGRLGGLLKSYRRTA